MQTFGKTELSKKTGVPRSTIPHFEKRLDLKVSKNDMGQRIYSDDDVILFKEIRRLREKEISFEEIKKTLNSRLEQKEVTEVAEEVTQLSLEKAISIEDILNDSRALVTVPANMLKEFANGSGSKELEAENQRLRNELSQASERISFLEIKLKKFSSLAGELVSFV